MEIGGGWVGEDVCVFLPKEQKGEIKAGSRKVTLKNAWRKVLRSKKTPSDRILKIEKQKPGMGEWE